MQDILATILSLRIYSVVMMVTVFSLLMVTVFWPGRRARFERDAQIPLEDDR
ncbi:MAG: cbb3-type cytochrome c oxidase subunit 3 [Alphaproteobacteria bacterium]|nr:cbb3-type cytochrome c oxidase subunit 3 [Alphaproteobacteria bacterium]